MDRLRSYLAVYDYGQGGIWLLLDAPSCAEAQDAFPQFTVYATRPSWMSDETEAEYREQCEKSGYRWSILSPPTGWLKQLVESEPS